MIRWTLDIPEETDQNVRKYLDQMQGGENDLSRFVDQAVNQAMLISSVEALWERIRICLPNLLRSLPTRQNCTGPKHLGTLTILTGRRS